MKSLYYCQKYGQFDHVYILSAKYGLLSLDQVIEPYDVALSEKTRQERNRWAERVKIKLDDLHPDQKLELWFFCGRNYNEHFEGVKPFKNLSIGRCLSKINEMISELEPKETFNLTK